MSPRPVAGRLRFLLLGLSPLLLFAAGISAQTPATVPPAAVQVQPPPPPEFDPASEPAVRAVAQVLPAVVNIATERVVRRTVQDPMEELFDRFFNEGESRSGTKVLRQKVQSLGTGFLVDPEGLIVTNEHVVERAADLKIQVTFADGTALPARYVTGDKGNDLALIKVERREGGSSRAAFPYIDLGKLSPNLLGQTVLVLGNPLGYNSSVARGILSAKDREITVEEVAYRGLVQTDAAINPGNSGGPLIDLAGRLVGVSSVKMSFTPQGTPTQGLGFAIPGRVVAGWVDAHRLAATAPSLKPSRRDRPDPGTASAGGSRTRDLFGLSLRGVSGNGAVITEVEPDSPAAEGGLRAGMFLLKVGTHAVTSPASVEALFNGVPAGTAVDFLVGIPGAGGTRRLETITLLARPGSTT